MFLGKISVFLALAGLGLCSNFLLGPPPDPPRPDEPAKMARYIMRYSDWVSIASISTQKAIQGYPFVSVKSVSDGPPANSTGVLYLYLTALDMTAKDLLNDSRCTVMASLAESDYCQKRKIDPEDPRCAKVMITGKMIKVDKASPEYKFGQNALFTKHPVMRTWPKDHNFYVTKVDIEQIVVMDSFGGPKYVSIEDYFNANNTSVPDGDIPFNHVEFIDVTA